MTPEKLCSFKVLGLRLAGRAIRSRRRPFWREAEGLCESALKEEGAEGDRFGVRRRALAARSRGLKKKKEPKATVLG